MDPMNDRSTGSELMPYKVVDCTRERRFGIVASSLQDFVIRGKIRLILNNLL